MNGGGVPRPPRRWASRLGADSLAGRTLWLLVGGLGLLHLGSMAAHERALHGAEVAALEARAADRIVSAGVVAAARPPAERDAAVRDLSLPGLSLRWSAEPPAAADLPADSFAELRGRLAEALAPQVADPTRHHLRGAWPDPSGGWVVFDVHDIASHGVPARWEDWLPVAAMALGILLAAVPIVGWMTGPLRRLAAAAERVGRDPREPVRLATDGPVEVREAAAAFNRMQARIARLVEDRTEALAAMSHDLRTPLARLRLRAEFLPEGEDRARIEAEVSEMEAMVAQTLDYVREGRDGEPAVPTDLAAILQTLASDASDAGHDVAYEGPARAVLPLRRLAAKRAFANLVDNAVRHGTGPVRLSIAEAGRGEVVARVADAGPGIAERDRARALDPFVQLDASRGAVGAGLGLAIARRFAEASGGRLELGRSEAGGLLASVALPRPG